MPVFFQKNIDDDARLIVWHITEDETFFLRYVKPDRVICHPLTRLQHIAGRYLLYHLCPDFPFDAMAVAPSGKPFVRSNSHTFSISHSGYYVAAILTRHRLVGIDVQVFNPKIVRVQKKILTKSELAYIAQSKVVDKIKALTLLWSVKEAVYKYAGDNTITLKEHIEIVSRPIGQKGVLKTNFYTKGNKVSKIVAYVFFEPIVLTYVL